MSEMSEHENDYSLCETSHNNTELNYFAIFAAETTGYAIPLANIQEFVLLPTTEEKSFVVIEEEKIPCISLKSNHTTTLGRQAGYMICKKNSKEKVAIVIEEIHDCLRLFIKALPFSMDELPIANIKDFISDGIKVYHTEKINGYQFDVLCFQ